MKSLLTAISLALAFVSPAFAGIEWNFPDGALSVTGSQFGSPGTGTAAITPGTYGWGYGNVGNPQSTWSTFGSAPGASGLWALGGTSGGGTPGSIVLTIGSGSGLTTLNVFQWVDPTFFYDGSLTVSANNGPVSYQTRNPVSTLTLDGAGWYDYIYTLSAPLVSGDQVTITAGSGGAIIDQLTLVPEPATMIAGAILLIPFALSTWPILRRRKTS